MIAKQRHPAESASPTILIASEDHDRLLDLAHSMLDRAPGAGELLDQLERATVIDKLPGDVIGMNSPATFVHDGSTYRGFRIVYPNEADIAQKRISVLTPVGAMLLGLSEGQSVEWETAGRRHRLRVERVGAQSPRARPPVEALAAR
jgi:regulator of nucleoside diphosphate kinase